MERNIVFFYYLNYDKAVSLKLSKFLNDKIKLLHKNQKWIKVSFWHDQEVQFKLNSIELNDVVLCAEIIGINQLLGNDITLVLHRNKKIDDENTQFLDYYLSIKLNFNMIG